MIVLDTSAIIAILDKEPESELFRAEIAKSEEPVISAISYYEAMLAYTRFKGVEGAVDVSDLLSQFEVSIMAFEAGDAERAFTAYARFGKGFHSKAKLNLCDCVAFALAQKMNAPLLFKGEDFAHTTVTPAIASKG